MLDRLETYAFFLDIDGTLADIAVTPADAFVNPYTLDTIRVLGDRTGGAVALISGRQLTDVDRMVSSSSLSAAGSHGAEIRLAGACQSTGAVRSPLLDRLEDLIAARFSTAAGLLIERKPFSVAVHYRANPTLHDSVNTFLDSLVREDDRLTKLLGKQVAEIVPSNVNKGSAIATFMSHKPFEGRTPIFAGDDVTDEDGFKAVNELDGISIRIGPGPSCARHRFDDAAKFRIWLDSLVMAADSTP